jgi:hypothetical protein
MFAPVITFHNCAVLSHEAEANCFPSGENATEKTKLEWPLSVAVFAPVIALHNRIVLSREAEANCFPSGENATEETDFE